MRSRLLAGILAAGLVLLPIGIASPAQAVQTVRSLACYSSLTCNPANLPILADAGIMSGAGTTAATGATAAVAATGAAGSLGFGTVVAATGAAVGIGLLSLYGVDEGLYIQTDPGYTTGDEGGYRFGGIGLGGVTVTMLGTRVIDWHAPSQWHTYTVHCFGISGSLSTSVQLHVRTPALSITGSGGATLSRAEAWNRAASNSTLTAYTGPITGSGFIPSSTTCPAGTTHYQRSWFDVSSSTYNQDWRPPVYADRIGLGPAAGPTTVEDGLPIEAGYHGLIRTQVSCIAPGWSQPSVVTAQARIDLDPGSRIPVPAVKCDAPGVAKSAKVEYKADGSAVWIELGSGDATATVSQLVDEYPSCFSSTGATLCELQLQRKEGTSWATCGPLAEFCPTWVEEWSETPDIFRCRFGSYDVPMSRCSAFRKPGTVLPNVKGDEDGDGAPDPIPPTAPAPTVYPNPVVNPGTGEQVETPPWLDTDGTTSPEGQARECWPSGWGVLNPFSWVFMPVGCALQDAFVPRASVVTAMRTAVDEAAAETAPAQITRAVQAWAFHVPESSCGGMTITWPWAPDDPQSFLASCAGDPFESMAVTSRWVSFLVVVFVGVFAIIRYIAGIVAYRGLGAGE